MTEVSIVIVSWNRRDDLLACLGSLRTLTYRNHEIIVVDNGSTDGTVEAVTEAAPSVRILRAEGNTGTSVSRNAGVRVATGRYLWFLDSDCVVMDADAIEQFIARFESDPALGAMGGESMRDGAGMVTAFRVMRLLGNALTETEIVPAAQPHREADAIPTCNLFMPRAVFEAAGGFDPLFFHYLEDLDLTWRIKRMGYRLLVGVCPDVDHRMTATARRPDLFTPKRNRVLFALKHFTAGQLAMMPVHDIAYLIAPARIRTLLRFSRGPSGAANRDPGVRRWPSVRGLSRACWIAFQIVLSLPASYVLALPYLSAAWRARDRGGGLDMTDMSLFSRPLASGVDERGGET